VAALQARRVAPEDAGGASAFLGGLMGKLEADGAALGVLREHQADDMAIMERAGVSVFASADRADRAGAGGSKEVLRSYMAAGTFLDTVRHLAPGANPKLDDMAKYAKFRAGVILKNLKAGLPTPPPEGASGACMRDTHCQPERD
jgi:hypothetical protein